MLSAYQILQINATVIAGLLILFTIISIEAESIEEKIERVIKEAENVNNVNKEEIERISNAMAELAEEKNFTNNPKEWIYFVGTPFAFSSILAVFYSLYEGTNSKGERRLRMVCLASMAAGFFFLLGIFFVI